MTRPALTALLIAGAALALAVGGCGSNEPVCSEFDDDTGRAIILCPNGRQIPVCDMPGTSARFEREETGSVLRGGDEARCNAEREPTCPAGTEDPAYCITVPEL